MAQKTADTSNTHVIITVLGQDHPGIVAGVAVILSDHKANILDIAQTIVRGTFSMTMAVDVKDMDLTFKDLQSELQELAQTLRVQITCQREDVFQFMYRL